MRWRIEAFNWNGAEVNEIRAAKSRKLNLRLNSPDTLQFSMEGTHAQALFIQELITDVLVYSESTAVSRMRAGNTQDTVGETGYGVVFNFNDYRNVLQRRKLRSTDTLSYSDDQAEIAWGLVQDVQARTNGDYGITQGVGSPTGVSRVRNFKEGQYVGKLIQDMSAVDDGFDWWINPDMELDIFYPQRGADNGISVVYGKSVVSFTRTRNPGTFANDDLITGGPSTTSVNQEAVDVDTALTGRWDRVFSYPDVSDQDTLDAKGPWAIAQTNVITGSYNVRLAPNFWEGPSHIDVGDTVRGVFNVGRLTEDFSARVTEISVAIGDDGSEDVNLVLVPT